jgi:MoxR-like ATPase
VVPDDLYALAPDVILHRIRLTYEALADGKRGDDVLQDILHDLTRGKPGVNHRGTETQRRPMPSSQTR